LETPNNNPTGSSILDRIMGSQTQSSLNEFDPSALVDSLLAQLKDRDREIVALRFGLSDAGIETLESIGKRHNLTRERVRQIEKDSLNFLAKLNSSEKTRSLQMIFDTIMEHGSIMSEDFLLATILLDQKNTRDLQALKFLLNIDNELIQFKETPDFYPSWHIMGFDLGKLTETINQMVAILDSQKQVVSEAELYNKFRETEFFRERSLTLQDKVLQSYLNISKAIQINAFNEIGLKGWPEVKPRDVGDKAYLVLKHHGKPEHYGEITKMINDHKFDDRTAYQETVHNELIKDNRFVLVGRGIYALTEWGFKKGVVADVIKEVITNAGKPLTRDEIIREVLRLRQVKRNTILVGLSNRNNFTKVGKDRYDLAKKPNNETQA
jgi:hypothetical protein